MDVDARTVADGATLECDLCIVGAGPAGLTLADALRGAGADIVILESGGHGAEAAAQDLNDGTTVGSAYGDLRQVRHRQVGGAANIWNTGIGEAIGAKYVPLDPLDFAARSWVPLSGWPFGAEELAPFYAKAQRVCGLGRSDYDAATWTSASQGTLPFGGGLTTRIYQFGLARPFVVDLPAVVAAAPTIRLVHHATACRIATDAVGEHVHGVQAVGVTDARFSVRARLVVLAMGAIENARLLLASSDARPEGLGNGTGWVGRCFMEHPRDFAIRWVPARRAILDEAGFYDIHAAPCGTMLMGRLAIQAEALRVKGLPQASATLLPFRGGGSSWLGQQAHRAAAALGFGDALLRRYPRGGAEWSRHKQPSAAYDAVRLLLNTEQFPNPENRIVLGTTRDRYGVPRAALHWHWTADDQRRLTGLRAVLREGIEGAGLGGVEFAEGVAPNPLAHHHAGTTRMHADPSQGVVDADGRVHGIANLYVAGGSVFPTAGFANPTLTIVALALRLADRLKGLLAAR
jgi:choline dehydrogenase-like flavoprotein